MPFSLTKEIMVDDRLVTIQVCFYCPSRLALTLTHVDSFGIRLGKSASNLSAWHFIEAQIAACSYMTSTAQSLLRPWIAGMTSSSRKPVHMIPRTSLLSSLVTRLTWRKADDRYDSLSLRLSASTRCHRLRKSGQWRGVNPKGISRTLRHLQRRLSMSSRLSKRYRVRRCNNAKQRNNCAYHLLY